jgi:hypothetical protein
MNSMSKKVAGESNYVLDPTTLDVSGSLEVVTKRAGAALEKKYPGWWWCLNPDEEAGVFYIYSLRLSGEWGYVVKTSEMQETPAKTAIMAGGEILERYNIRRGKYKRSLLLDKMVDLRGNYIPDITDRHSKSQKAIRDRALTKAIDEGKAKIVHSDTVQEDGTVFRQVAIRLGEEDVNSPSSD